MRGHDGGYWIVDEAASFNRSQWVEVMQRSELRRAARERRTGETREVDACSPLGGEPSMKAPDPASHTVERSALGEREELG